MDILTLVNPKAWGLDTASAAILVGVGTYVWRSLQHTISSIPERILRLFSYNVSVGPLAAVSVALSDYILVIESDPSTKMLIRPRNFMPQSIASSSTLQTRRNLTEPSNDVVEESGNGALSIGIGTYLFWTKRYGLLQLTVTNQNEERPNSTGNTTNFYDIVRYNAGENIKRTVRFFGGPNAKLKLHTFMADAVLHYKQAAADKRNCFVYRASSWTPTIELKNSARRLEGIFSDNDVANTLAKSVGEFLAAKPIYNYAGIPYHYGILLYGPPGTGKTTLAQSVANYHGMPLYVFQFKSYMSDNDIVDALRSIPPRSIVLFEDIDCSTSVVKARPLINDDDAEVPISPRPQQPSNTSATLSGLLNSLDGVFAPSDVVYLFTTNDKDAIDAGLLRRGRIDDHYHMGYIGKESQRRMAEYLGCPVSIVDSLPEKAPPCDVQDLALRYLRQ